MQQTSALQAGYAEINGGKIYYEVMGEGHPLLLIHGFPIDSRMWNEQFDEFAKSYRVVRFDLRNLGKSELAEAPFSNYEDIRALLQFLNIEETYVVGLSFGGYTATEFALTYPEMVDGLVLVAAGQIGFPQSEQRQASAAQFNELTQTGDVEQVADFHVTQWYDGPGQSPDRVAPEGRALFRQMALEAYQKPQAKIGPTFLEPRPITRLEEIQAPTLILLGELDFVDMTTIGNLYHEKIANSQLITMNGVAHMPNMEQPEVFNKLVLDYLGGLK